MFRKSTPEQEWDRPRWTLSKDDAYSAVLMGLGCVGALAAPMYVVGEFVVNRLWPEPPAGAFAALLVGMTPIAAGLLGLGLFYRIVLGPVRRWLQAREIPEDEEFEASGDTMWMEGAPPLDRELHGGQVPLGALNLDDPMVLSVVEFFLEEMHKQDLPGRDHYRARDVAAGLGISAVTAGQLMWRIFPHKPYVRRGYAAVELFDYLDRMVAAGQIPADEELQDRMERQKRAAGLRGAFLREFHDDSASLERARARDADKNFGE